ncbi:MAG: sulfur oxidation c-type cytochrome SoxA [Meiothermus sp.]|uniref:sulfur oxidation c-type cytochrome SoxA n=1 Tax=Meiothermus sp. TaxID=1955249 RepID=UPI0025F49028|nr:sulfur oxidation c-type cytochrome SoxA [Meiothermus sp.]MCS7058089.1 sulfur oxidation c-type cytochrome SoxA [Meiothermus sp.]MCS7194054.1 sulfur oxidation c-type cytochrome SoxA [Meiothermus sp.]MCX7740425.1 sulfur oxidation c-type cytochrome SoxA [Meiothermus sp.]MDW8091170.1 sulfur oxidation c-type cytochrome SoxA [Meiothermus sp.]MDW8480452.1 sulfur oxidation c-type cytochrome SoxA [Meiothermus sp.]
MRRNRLYRVLGLALLGFALGVALTQSQQELDPYKEAERQRELFRQTAGILPGELYAAQGEELFYAKRGPRQVSLEACDFGLGPGKLEGALTQLPRYFADTRRVEDLETRIVSCMVRLQGFRLEDIKRDEVKALVAYVASKSSEMPINVVPRTSQEVAMYNLGRELWYHRAGDRDMNCAICHESYAGRKVRLSPVRSPRQGLSNEWPAYRFEADKLYTLQDRIAFCYESIGIRPPVYYSEPYIALSMYMLAEATKGKNRFTEMPGFTR